MHCCGCKLRPPSIGCYPVKDGCKVIMYDGLFFDPDFGRNVWGRVYYDEPLSEKEEMSYDLVDRECKGLSKYERCLMVANRFYESGDYDRYERAIGRLAKTSGKPYWQVEDDVTDARIIGIDGAQPQGSTIERTARLHSNGTNNQARLVAGFFLS